MTPVEIRNHSTAPPVSVEFRYGKVGKKMPRKKRLLLPEETFIIYNGFVAYIGNQVNRIFQVVGHEEGGKIIKGKKGELEEDLPTGKKIVDSTSLIIATGRKKP